MDKAIGAEQIGALAAILEWGAIGLAGLMLVLVVIAITTQEITANKKSLLQTFMFVGGMCFLAALAGEVFLKSTGNSGRHKVVLNVWPNDLAGSEFPTPEVKIDNALFDYKKQELIIESATTLSVDVSAAVGLFRSTAEKAQLAEAEVAETLKSLEEVSEQAATAERQADVAQQLVGAWRKETESKEVKLRETETELEARVSELEQKDADLEKVRGTVDAQMAALNALAEQTNVLETSIQELTVVPQSGSSTTFRAPAATAPSTATRRSTLRSLENNVRQIDRTLNGVGVFR